MLAAKFTRSTTWDCTWLTYVLSMKAWVLLFSRITINIKLNQLLLNSIPVFLIQFLFNLAAPYTPVCNAHSKLNCPIYKLNYLLGMPNYICTVSFLSFTTTPIVGASRANSTPGYTYTVLLLPTSGWKLYFQSIISGLYSAHFKINSNGMYFTT